MKATFTRRFSRKLGLLDKKIQAQFKTRLELFLKNLNHPQLNNHSLRGRLLGKRAFSVSGGYRAIFRYVSKTEIKMINIGTYNQVY